MAEYINKSEVNGLLKLGWSGDAIVTAITNGGISSVPAIPIPKGATNGDMIKAMFPNGKEYDNDGDVRYEIEIDFDYSFCSYFDGVWWNAPYKGNLSEKPTGSESEDKEWVMKIGL